MIPDFLLYAPTVYCVGDRYQIVFITQKAGAGAVIVGGKPVEHRVVREYTIDISNGI